MSHGLGPFAVAVLGQPVLDRFLYGVTHRISREAPVLVVREESQADFLGGAANTAANLAGLGLEARLVGPVGVDAAADELRSACCAAGVPVDGLVPGGAPVTVTKTRILAGGLHTTRQQMLRIDREREGPPTEPARAALMDAGRRALVGARAVIVSDYGDDGLVDLWVELAAHARALGLPVVVDSRRSLLRFRGASAVTPNEPEAEAALGRPLRTAEEAAAAAVELRDRLDLDAALLTRGALGMVLAPRGAPPVHIPAVGGEAVDVTGAGDTVAATFTAAWSAGLQIEAAARLANRAAAVVVQTTGTVAIRAEDIAWGEALFGADSPGAAA